MSQGKLQITNEFVDAAARTFDELDAVIMKGVQTFVEVGFALMEMRDGKRYRDGGYATFEDYCQKRLGWAKRTAYYYLEAAEVLTNVHSSAQNAPSLTQAREMHVLTPEQQRELASTTDFAHTTVDELKEKVKEIRKSHRVAHNTGCNERRALIIYDHIVDLARAAGCTDEFGKPYANGLSDTTQESVCSDLTMEEIDIMGIDLLVLIPWLRRLEKATKVIQDEDEEEG